MNFNIDDAVTLDNGKEYYLIDKNILDGDTYFYAVEYTDDIDQVLNNEYCFFKVEDQEYLVKVEDDIIKSKLIKLFIDKISSKKE